MRIPSLHIANRAGHWFRIALGAIVLSISFPSTAEKIDLSQPITVRPGRGVALFSFTLSNELQQSTWLSWRAVGKTGDEQERGDVALATTGWFKNEELANTAHRRRGALFGLDLPPGLYEFYQFRSSGQQKTVSAKDDFSRTFMVEAGKIAYIGNLDLLTGENDFGGGRLLLAFIFGIFTDAYTTYPTLIDRSDIDLPLLLAKGNGLTRDAVAVQVITNEADNAMLAAGEALRAGVESADLQSQLTLLMGLARGWAVLPDQRRVKFFDGRDAWPALAAKLTSKGIPGAATYLGMRNDLAYSALSSSPGVYEKDDQAAALQYYLVDAGRYQEIAIMRAKRLLKTGSDQDSNVRQLAMLDHRLDGLQALTPESLPYGNDATRTALRKYREVSPPKYFALSRSGAHGMSSGEAPSMKAALELCAATNSDPGEPCLPYAVYSRKVWNPCPADLSSDRTMHAPPYTGLGDVTSAERLPKALDDSARRAHGRFLELGYPRAIAFSDQGAFGLAGGDCQAAYRALLACTRQAQGSCRLWGIDDQIVYGAENEELREAEQRLLRVVTNESEPSRAQLTSGGVR